MTLTFADTSYYQALISGLDEYHDRAIFLSRVIDSEVVTTEWVLTELLNTFSRGKARRRTVAGFVHGLRLDEHVLILPATSIDWTSGFELYRQRVDQEWSLVDCIAFQLMWEREITQALTFDEHFEQAGFERVR